MKKETKFIVKAYSVTGKWKTHYKGEEVTADMFEPDALRALLKDKVLEKVGKPTKAQEPKAEPKAEPKQETPAAAENTPSEEGAKPDEAGNPK